MTQNSISPEDLYLQYRQTRPRIAPDFAPKARNLRSMSDAEAPSLPEQVYLAYQQDRRVDREESIDAILSLVRREQSIAAADLNTYADHETGSHSVAESEPGMRPAKPVFTGSRTTWIDQVKHWFELRSPALLLPVIAAGLLALFVFPQIFDSADTASGLPASLISQAPSAIEYIDPNNAQILSFSASAAPGKSAFNHGVLATNYRLAVHAMDEQVISDTLRSIASIAETEDQVNLVTLISEIMDGSDDQSAGDLSNYTDTVVSMLRTLAEESGHDLWFEHGRALQAVTLSAYLQQSMLDGKPLSDSLSAFSTLATPLPVLPASKLVQELKSYNDQSVKDGSSSRKVVGLTRDIKILMQ